MGRHGRMSLDDIRSRLPRPADVHEPLDVPRRAREHARGLDGPAPARSTTSPPSVNWRTSGGVPLHVDGARIFNASVALGTPVSELLAAADSASFCLSKGLACPVGSLVVGSKELIWRARRARKLVGGGMRQVGVLAAPGLIALRDGPAGMIERLADDHANARRLAEGIAEMPGVVGLDPGARQDELRVHRPCPPGGLRTAFLDALAAEGVLMIDYPGSTSIRAVTHYGIEAADIDAAIDATHRALAAVGLAPSMSAARRSPPVSDAAARPRTPHRDAGRQAPRRADHALRFRRAHGAPSRLRHVPGPVRARRRVSATAAATRSSRTQPLAHRLPDRARADRPGRAFAVLRDRARAGACSRPGARSSTSRCTASGSAGSSATDEIGDGIFLLMARGTRPLSDRLDVDRRAARAGAAPHRAAEDAARRAAAGQALERDGARRDRLDAVALRRGRGRGRDRVRRGHARGRATRDGARQRHARARRIQARGSARRSARATEDYALGRENYDELVGLRAFDGLSDRRHPRDRRAAAGREPRRARRAGAPDR